MLSDVHAFFEGKVHSYHVYYGKDKISISISPKSFTEKKEIERLVHKFMKEMEKQDIQVEVHINCLEEETDFDYMPERID